MQGFESAASVITDGLSFLGPIGFETPNYLVNRTPLLGNILVVTYENSQFHRAVELSFSPRRVERSASVVLFLCTDSGERFSLEDWLNNKGEGGRVEFRNKANEEVFLQTFCRQVEPILTGPLLETLLGNDWDKVDFDWKQYR